MAEVTKPDNATISTGGAPPNTRIGGWKCGETIASADAIALNPANGKLVRANGAAADALARVVGFAGEPGTLNKGVTILKGVNIGYPTGLPSGTLLYLSGTVPGGLADAPSAGGASPIAMVMDAGIIHVYDTPGT